MPTGVELVVAEIVTNAVRHVRGTRPGRYVSRRRGVTVAVSEASVDLPVVGDADGGNGRGLVIVAALLAGWGSHDVPGGKRVWARIVR